MAIKKSELYSALWAGCDELRGGMDASQYKDYVLTILFIKYISDKYADDPFAPIEVPEGASFRDMVNLKGKDTIGDDINKKIVGPLKEINKLSEMPDFADPNKLGEGKEMVERLTNLIAIFERPELNFANNRAENDDLLGDAYEYLMRHFATESGKSKGQFYTPAEVSRIMANIIGIADAKVTASTSVYDPTCGSGSLLLKVSAEVEEDITLFGQEKDNATATLARMNMILHNNPGADIKQGNTLTNPMFHANKEKSSLKLFDYAVANPPFSDKRWMNGLTPDNDKYNRFELGIPPGKNGDYAYLLHLISSLKSTGKGAIILPHGVLFRGNAEAELRKNIIRRGYISGIIGLPANLFYGTGIPAAIIMIDKAAANYNKGIFFIDASKGFLKDGNKNRLREQDIRMITDVFNSKTDIPGYSRMVSVAEVEENDFNLNIPRYIDNQEKEDIQDIFAHLNGGIPAADIDALEEYWKVFPKLKHDLLAPHKNEGYYQLLVEKGEIRNTILNHKEFKNYQKKMSSTFFSWKFKSKLLLNNLDNGLRPKEVIQQLAKHLFEKYEDVALINPYDIYQILMDYWNEVMQDDLYMISADGWRAETYRILVENGKRKKVDKGWTCDLIPKSFVVDRFFLEQRISIDMQIDVIESLQANLTELEEDNGGEEGAFSGLEKINKSNVSQQIKDIKAELKEGEDDTLKQHLEVLEKYVSKVAYIAKLNKELKHKEAELDEMCYNQYPELSPDIVQEIVIDDKWLATLESRIGDYVDSICQVIAVRVAELAERYDETLDNINERVAYLEKQINSHLITMNLGVIE